MNAALSSAAVIAAAMILLWMLSLAVRDASIVDIFWGPGFALVAWTSWLVTPHPPPGSLLLVALTTVWGARLGVYLAMRNLGKGEDARYQRIRRRVGPRFPLLSLFIVFGLQGVLLWIVSLPVREGMGLSAPGTPWLASLGALVWLVGLTFEAVGDFQLSRFKAEPANAGKVMDRGLWRYTRHPNYFGDFLVWWGLYLVALAAGAPAWTALGPAVMTFLLTRVSGVPLLERSLRERRPDYAAYIQRTSSFFPLPPRG